MFEPTIKYRRVNDPPQNITKQLDDLTISKQNEQSEPRSTSSSKDVIKETTEKKQDRPEIKLEEPIKEDPKSKPSHDNETNKENKEPPTRTAAETSNEDILASFTFEEEEEESTIEVDPNDEDRVIITLSTGKKYAADRYCPHAGVDLSSMGKVSEHDYPPEIGPVLMCTYHYWEFALDKEGRGAHNSSLHACPIEDGEPCPVISEKKELEW